MAWPCTGREHSCLRLVHTTVHGVYGPCTRPYMTRPEHGRVYGPCPRPCTDPVHSVHGPCTWSVHGPNTAVSRPVHGRVWSCTRAVNWSCIWQWTTRKATYTLPCTMYTDVCR